MTLIGIAVGTVVVALLPDSGPIALAASAVFGAAFMTLTGLHLVSAVRPLPNRAARPAYDIRIPNISLCKS
ncbi:hypothetical protein [Halofilum ochraceum]|uniref:hypothetical protein n=1 Tax=Halofilum ochraceum TaxID=1611323 RepID=UPI0008D91B5E|nr:hypothetical protein [Halofilum ochraceum]